MPRGPETTRPFEGHSLALRFLIAFALAVTFFAAGPVDAQEKKNEDEKAESTEKKDDGKDEKTAGDDDAESKDGEAAKGKAEPEKEKTPEERHAELLERIADSLSKRMRAVAEREKAVSEREKALAEREQALKEREALQDAREKIIEDREEPPKPQAWNGSPSSAPKTVGKYIAVIDANTGQYYYEKSGATKTPVASTQKLMTALVICSEDELDDLVTVPKSVLQVEPTVVGVKPGQKFTRRQLLEGLLVRSGNDLAHTLAVTSAGSVEAFAEKMNTMARTLGMKNTHFNNPHGLPSEGQYSTAHDMALLARRAYQHPVIRGFVKTRQCEFKFPDGNVRTLYNTNRVLTSNDYCNGMKTGFTYASGHCLVCSGKKGDQDRIVVVIKSYKPYVWSDSEKMLDWALDLDVEPAQDEDQDRGDEAKADSKDLVSMAR